MIFFLGLIVFILKNLYEEKHIPLTEAPWNQLTLDHNLDGIFTISDVSEFLIAVFFMPSDSILFFIFDLDPIISFFEISKTYNHGFLSTLWSLWIWIEALFWTSMFYSFLDTSKTKDEVSQWTNNP